MLPVKTQRPVPKRDWLGIPYSPRRDPQHRSTKPPGYPDYPQLEIFAKSPHTYSANASQTFLPVFASTYYRLPQKHTDSFSSHPCRQPKYFFWFAPPYLFPVNNIFVT